MPSSLTKTPVLCAVLCCLTLSGLAGCSQRPTAHVTGVEFADVTLQSLTILFNVEVSNPYPVAIPLVNMDYNLTSQGNALVSGKTDMQGTVPAGGKTCVCLPAKLVYLDLLKVLREVRPGAVIPYAAELGLSVDAPVVGAMRLPLTKEGQLPIPAVPDLRVSEIKWNKISLDDASGVVKLSLTNPNKFAVDMKKLDYALSLGGVEVAKAAAAREVSCAADGGTGDLEIPISMSPKQAGLAVFRLLSGSKGGYRIKGELNLGTPFGPMRIPIDKTGEASFRH